MPASLLLSTIAILLLVQYHFKKGFRNRYIDNLFSLLVIFAVLTLFIKVSIYEGVKGLTFLTTIFICHILLTVRELNKIKGGRKQ